MDHSHQHDDTDPTPRRGKWVLLGFLLIAGFFLFTEHRAHLFGFLPFLLILACPMMHLFHHGHGHRSGSAPRPDTVQPEQEQARERP